MSTKESITCDGCGTELIKDTMYPHEFALELSVIDTNRPSNNITYAIAQFPPFEGKMNFCDNKCLIKWVGEQ